MVASVISKLVTITEASIIVTMTALASLVAAVLASTPSSLLASAYVIIKANALAKQA